ncbi:SNF2 family DNA or RNA helicase [Fontibacillus solani]|uniref:SNF2 family DNA or RNA helicase n=1 Tax=Fontibacillus solani TaxID=1572857 RepID=A0A7W3SX20_9BACL|nr:DEAD/DEAH box helicase [Fontibacillus solani]MBA9087503.1 SNF2 family DNA or RNA helicase [Fontibacillus solani]
MQLYPHQEQALNQTEQFNRVAYYLDMGLGKTFVGSEKMNQLACSMNLLVCQKSKIDDWIEHFQNHYRLTVRNLTNKTHLEDFIRWNQQFVNVNSPLIVGVINYDLLFRRKRLLDLRHFTLMLDESSMIQNEKAKRTKFILEMKPDNVILLSGTPTSGKYENLYSQAQLLGWKVSKKVFNSQYINWRKVDIGGFPQWIVDDAEPYKNVERLKAKLRQHGAIFMKTEECFELPEQIMIPVMIKPNKEYRQFQRKCIVKVKGTNWVEDPAESDFHGVAYKLEDVELIGDTTLTKRLYSRQLCGHYNKEKLQAFADLVCSTQDRLIVFYNYTAELDALKKIAESLKKPISEVNGQVKDLYSYEHEENSITFIQYQAGAMGLNLQKANKIIYFTLTDKSELFEQSKKRIHRIGQTNTCFYYLMLCEGSVEEDILRTLEMRKDYTDELFEEYERKA